MRIKAIYGKSQQSTIECHEPIISSCEANELAGANGREVGWMGKKHEPAPSESRKPNGPPRGARFKIRGNITHPKRANAVNRVQTGNYQESHLLRGPGRRRQIDYTLT